MEQATALHAQQDIKTIWYQHFFSLETKTKWTITITAFLNVTFLSGIFIFFIIGGSIYAEEHAKELNYAQSSCRVYSTFYKQYRCNNRRPVTICYAPVWNVGYGQNETSNTTISSSNRYRLKSDAIKQGEEYQIDSFYTCWYDREHPLKMVQWEEPDSRIGVILMFFGGITTILTIVSLLLIYRFCRRIITQEQEQE